MEIYRGPRGNNGKIYESDYFVDEMDFEFPTVDFDDQQLCQCDPDSPIEIKFINRNQYQMVNQEICHVVTTLKELERKGNVGGKLDLITNEGKKVSKLIVNKFESENIPSFTDYIKAGCEISLIGAIDFTYSNGMPSNPTSLHYTGGHNQYVEAIRAVGDILNNYDSDKKYPFYGFGGVPEFMGQDEVSHCFPLNGNNDNPEIESIDGVLETYKENVSKIKFLGPTHFAPVIEKAKKQVMENTNEKMYYILLILTDGEIHDMKETIDQIADISNKNLPISIIVIGVGDEDFANMVKLDGDDVAIQSGVKDLVQFVKFQEVMRRSEPDQ